MRLSTLRVAAIILISAGVAGQEIAAETGTVTAGQALDLLERGNARFVSGNPAHPNASGERRSGTAADGQRPFAAILSCSDSRVPVEMVFDRGIGDIFVMRVAGNVAMDKSVIGSAEYAAGHLGVPLIVVMGHTDCGAVKAAISGGPLSGDVRDIQRKIEPVAKAVIAGRPGLEGMALTTEVVKANVRQAMEDLLSRSEELREMVSDGRVRIVTAIYDMATGRVEWIR